MEQHKNNHSLGIKKFSGAGAGAEAVVAVASTRHSALFSFICISMIFVRELHTAHTYEERNNFHNGWNCIVESEKSIRGDSGMH